MKMSKYTTEVRFICETAAGLTDSGDFDDIDDILDVARTKVFNFTYPIFDDNYRENLEKKILLHFYTREIGDETVGLWKLHLRSKLYDIMPYYNKLYESELLKFNPFYDTDYSKMHHGENSNTNDTNENNISTDTKNASGSRSGKQDSDVTRVGHDTQSSDATRKTSESGSSLGSEHTSQTGTTDKNTTDAYSDTPQGGLSDVANLEYLTNARIVSEDGTQGLKGETARTGKTDTSSTEQNASSGTATSSAKETAIGNTTETYSDTDNRLRHDSANKKTAYSAIDNYAEKVIGKTGGDDYSTLLDKFRRTFLNIDLMVIRELEPLFFGLW